MQRVVPVSILPARLVTANQFIAVIPGSPSLQATVDAFVAHAAATYAGLNFTTLAGGNFSAAIMAAFSAAGDAQDGATIAHTYIPPMSSVLNTAFASEADLEAYVRREDYGVDNSLPRVFAAIIFLSGAPTWEYAIRMNSTREVRTCG